ncbi:MULTISPECIES: VacJ family lipoprotein [unclassified Novosphingobium]|uniref:MlaA family lipoprotein n=2 Tax=Novosphingobium TaxID=165696 RepID=UPI000D2F5050|nr:MULTISPECIES: VacJ family lipoprotein [unclassified Novosphingobium]PTR06857.1 phospholipid-binding lipoprotein MlaA [Novosphingobium sp. GV055]PUA95135.1 phospholipid-binding lipoprotein MlaA [Novosphingobium sp. GV061]PUB14378.1 phospholipid-binding lipoprotein MlaA [Novosphingobium sp. GV079]PUB38726.1 phospholipid-binding lipoprotein MlaA [Novosphingobium sp. GV027]
MMIVLLAAALAGTTPIDDGAPPQPVAGSPAASASAVTAPAAPATASAVPSAPEQAPARAPDGQILPVIVLPTVTPVAANDTAAETQPADEGAIVVNARRGPPPGDPVIALNKVTFAATQAVDRAVIGPAAKAYGSIVPAPIRTGFRHFFTNLTEPVIALNFLLQLKPGKAAETLGRFAINSTIGVGGLLDVAVAKPFKLPYRRNGFGYTLAYYGVGPGPFLFVPLVGPTTLRDVIGLGLDRAFLPAIVGGPLRSPAYVTGSFVVRSLNDRLDDDRRIQAMRKAGDPYLAAKEGYLAARQEQIDELKGHKHKEKAAPPPDAQTPPAVVNPAAPAPAPTGPATTGPAHAPDGQVLPPIVLPAPAPAATPAAAPATTPP